MRGRAPWSRDERPGVTEIAVQQPIDRTDLGPGEGAITDAELEALALAADPERPLDHDAVPIQQYLSQLPSLLPDWYMPMAMAGRGSRWRGAVILVIVGAFLVIEALGLCSTYGQLAAV